MWVTATWIALGADSRGNVEEVWYNEHMSENSKHAHATMRQDGRHLSEHWYSIQDGKRNEELAGRSRANPHLCGN